MKQRLAVGTVQFGMQYGIANNTGMASLETVRDIVAEAQSQGVCWYDTAPCYGQSEGILGRLLPNQSQIITKTHAVASKRIHSTDVAECECVFQQSLKALRRSSVYGLMVHATEDLNKVGSDRLYAWLCRLKARGLVQKIGVSVYTPEQVDQITAQYDIDLVQFPLSLIDQRMIAQGHIAKLKAMGIELHVRSVFLQGLLLMKVADLPEYFSPYRDVIAFLHEQAGHYALTPLQLCLSFVLNIPEIDRVIIGVQTVTQFIEIMRTAHLPLDVAGLRACGDNRSGLIYPTLWQA